MGRDAPPTSVSVILNLDFSNKITLGGAESCRITGGVMSLAALILSLW